MQPPLPHSKDVTTAASQYLRNEYVSLRADRVCGPVHRAAYPTRCFFVDTTLWTEPALAPTAVIPKLPEKRDAGCGYEQLELGDEEQLARYPVLQAIRSGMKLDTESYTRGNYQTVPIVPGMPLPGERQRVPSLDNWPWPCHGQKSVYRWHRLDQSCAGPRWRQASIMAAGVPVRCPAFRAHRGAWGELLFQTASRHGASRHHQDRRVEC